MSKVGDSIVGGPWTPFSQRITPGYRGGLDPLYP